MKKGRLLLEAYQDLARRTKLLEACERHLGDVNAQSDKALHLYPRCPEVQTQYDRSVKLIKRIRKELEKKG